MSDLDIDPVILLNPQSNAIQTPYLPTCRYAFWMCDARYGFFHLIRRLNDFYLDNTDRLAVS
jgi:hypothetical protein